MKQQAVKFRWALALAIATSVAVTASPVALSAKGYAELDALPDWSGVWQPDWSSLFSGRGGDGPPAGPKLTAQAAATLADFNAKKSEGMNLQTDAANCIPPGMPGIMRMPYPLEFVYSPGRVNILHETYSQVRRIYTDGRPIAEDPDPQFNGNSVGHWEGDMLVVDTNGLNVNTTLSEGIHPTEATRIHETIQRTADSVITVTTTITDPSIYTEPYTFKQTYVREPDWQIREYVCQENNRDGADEFGRPTMDISRPGDLD